MTLRNSFLVLFAAVGLYGALPAATTWEVRPGVGSDANGGCFVPGATGTDYSQQNAAQYGASDLVAVTTSTVSSASHAFGAADLGDCIAVASGTGFTPGRYEIVSAAGGVATLDRAVGTMGSTGGVYAVGGAIATLGTYFSGGSNGNPAWVKSTGTISTTATVTTTLLTSGSQIPALSGYAATRGDGGQVTVRATASLTPVLSVLHGTVQNFIIDCNGQAATTGVTSGGAALLVNLETKNCTGTGITTNNNVICKQCAATGTSVGTGISLLSTSVCIDCVSFSNTVTGITIQNGLCIRCISASNSGASSDGVDMQNNFMLGCLQCVLYGNGRDGAQVQTNSQRGVLVADSIFWGNAQYGLNYTVGTSVGPGMYEAFNAFGGNGTAPVNNITASPSDVTLTADPFTNASAQDFSLNSTAGGGPLLKQAGFPGTLAIGGTGYLDIGALQSAGAGAAARYLGAVIQQ